jgi:hypothetical protein
MNSNRETGKSGVEQFLKDEVKKYGAVARKWVSPGYTGVPDQIVFWPTGLITFVETKAKKGKLEPRQVRVHEDLAAFGHDVVTLYTKEAVRLWVELQASVLRIKAI